MTRRRREEELDRDIREHLEMEIQDNLERGMTPEAARAAALRKFGNVARIKEDTRAVWGWTRVEQVLQDIRYALRMLRKNPGFAIVTIVTLALGIGMNTAVFSVVNAVLLKPLPYPNAERLVWLSDYNESFKMEAVAGPDFLDWKQQAQSFEKMAAYAIGPATISINGNADQAMTASVTGDFWGITGAQPSPGRAFAPGERGVVVLGRRIFERRLGSDPNIIGKTVTLDGRAVTVVGVMPPGFRFQFPQSAPSVTEKTEIEAYATERSVAGKPGSWPQHGRRQCGGEAESGNFHPAGPRGNGGDPGAHRPRESPELLQPAHAACTAAPGKTGGERAPRFAGSARRGGLRAADRLREHREPPAGARQFAAKGDCGANGLGRGAPARGPAVSGGRIGAVAGWRRGRVVAGAMGHRPDAAAGPAGGAAARRDRDGWARAGVHLRRVARHGPALRAGAGPRVLTNQAAPRVESGSPDLGEFGRIEPSPVAGGWRTGAGAGLADWRRPDAEELLADERAACGVPAREHSADESHTFRPELSRDTAATGLISSRSCNVSKPLRVCRRRASVCRFSRAS